MSQRVAILSSLLALVPACGGKVTTPSKPDVSYSPDPVAVGTQIRVSTSWEGWCEYSALEQAMFGAKWGPGEEDTTHPCKSVDYDAVTTCDDDACTIAPDSNGVTIVTPTKPGLLKARVTFKPRDGRKSKTIELQPINVLAPTSAKVSRCELWNDREARVDVDLFADKTLLGQQASVRIKGGPECTRDEDAHFGYAHIGRHGELACPITETKIELEVFTRDGYAIATTADCALVVPAPKLGITVSPEPGVRFAFVLKDPYMSCTDDLIRETRASFATFGWKEETTPAAGQTKFIASRNGGKVEVTLGEGKDSDDRRICQWSLRSDIVNLRGTHEFTD